MLFSWDAILRSVLFPLHSSALYPDLHFLTKWIARSKSPDMASDTLVQVSHHPVWRQTMVPVSLDGIMRPHRPHPRLSPFCSNGPNLYSPSPEMEPCVFVITFDDSVNILTAISLVTKRSGERLWKEGCFSICFINSLNSFEEGTHFIRFSKRRRRWWNRFLIPLSVLPGNDLTICDHLEPCDACRRNIVASSRADHSVCFRWGPRWFK